MAGVAWRFACFWLLGSMSLNGAFGLGVHKQKINAEGGTMPSSLDTFLPDFEARTIQEMQTNPQDVKKQRDGCNILGKYVEKANDEFQVVEAINNIAKVVVNHLEDTDLGMHCLRKFQNILHDARRGVWMAKSQGQEAIMAYMRRNAKDRDAQFNGVFLIGGTYGVPEAVTNKTSELGGFAYLFDVIKYFPYDIDLQMQTWRALSDPAYTPKGAAAIAHNGGPYEGIRYMVKEMKEHHKGHEAVGPSDKLDLLYEIMQVSAGTLQVNEKFAGMFLQEGFTSEIVHAMTVEQDLRGTQDVACKCMSKLAKTKWAAVSLMNQGAVALMKKAMTTFHDYDSTPFGPPGHTLGNEYPVIPFCAETLRLMAVAAPERAKQLMIEADLKPTLSSIRPDILSGATLLWDPQNEGMKIQSTVSKLLELMGNYALPE